MEDLNQIEAPDPSIVQMSGDRVAALSPFNALDGFEIKHQWVELNEKGDDATRRALTVRILSYVTVNGRALSTPQVINGTLKSWLEVDALVTACLAYNDITPKVLTDEIGPKYAAMGEKVAAGFLSEMSRLYGPMFELMSEQVKGGE
jgi:hypothetical protein